MKDCPHAPSRLTLLAAQDWGPVVTIRVGESQKEFAIHRGLLSHHSAYFDAQFSGRWGDMKVVDFDGADEVTFQAFFQYVYSHNLTFDARRTVRKNDKTKRLAAMVNEVIDVDALEDAPRNFYTFGELCAMYAMGNFVLCPGFKSAVVTAICDQLADEWIDPWNHVAYVYETTSPGCGLRRLLVDWFSKSFSDTWPAAYQRNGHQLPHDFLIEVIASLTSIVHNGSSKRPRTQGDWKACDRCTYHDHDDGGDSQAGDAMQE